MYKSPPPKLSGAWLVFTSPSPGALVIFASILFSHPRQPRPQLCVSLEATGHSASLPLPLTPLSLSLSLPHIQL